VQEKRDTFMNTQKRWREEDAMWKKRGRCRPAGVMNFEALHSPWTGLDTGEFVSWSSDSRYVAIGQTSRLLIWDFLEQSCVAMIPCEESKVASWAPGPSGEYRLAIAMPSQVLICSKKTPREPPPRLRRTLRALEINLNEATQSAAMISALQENDFMNHFGVVRRLEVVGDTHDLSWSPDGHLLAAATGPRWNGRLHIWRISKEAPYSIADHRELDPFYQGVYCVAWSPTGDRLASVGNELRVWERCKDDEKEGAPSMDFRSITCVQGIVGNHNAFWSADGVLASYIGLSGILSLFPPTPLNKVDGKAATSFGEPPQFLISSPNTLNEAGPFLLERENGGMQFRQAVSQGRLAAWSPDGSMIAAVAMPWCRSQRKYRTVFIWRRRDLPHKMFSGQQSRKCKRRRKCEANESQAQSSNTKGTFHYYHHGSSGSSFSSSRYSSSSNTSTNNHSSSTSHNSDGGNGQICQEANQTNSLGTAVTTQSRNTKISWSWQHETMEAPISLPHHPTGAAVIDTDMYTYFHVATLDGHASTITRIEWSPDGKHLATSSMDRTVCVWAMPFEGYITRSACISLLMLDGGEIRDFAWAPNGRAVVVVGDKVRIWKRDEKEGREEIRRGVSKSFPPEVVSIIEDYVFA